MSLTTQLLADSVKKGGPGSGPQGARQDAKAAGSKADKASTKAFEAHGLYSKNMPSAKLHNNAAKLSEKAADLHEKAADAFSKAPGNNDEKIGEHEDATAHFRSQANTHKEQAKKF